MFSNLYICICAMPWHLLIQHRLAMGQAEIDDVIHNILGTVTSWLAPQDPTFLHW